MKPQEIKGLKLENSAFDLEGLTEQEVIAMFMTVSVKSLDNWLAYYQGRDMPHLCAIITDAKSRRNAGG